MSDFFRRDTKSATDAIGLSFDARSSLSVSTPQTTTPPSEFAKPDNARENCRESESSKSGIESFFFVLNSRKMFSVACSTTN